MKTLNQDDWKKGIQDEEAVIIDVRTKEEFEDGYIPKAKLIDIQQPENFMSAMDELDKTKDYYVYCRSGARSNQACQVMDQLGFESTSNLDGGFSKWTGEKEKS